MSAVRTREVYASWCLRAGWRRGFISGPQAAGFTLGLASSPSCRRLAHFRLCFTTVRRGNSGGLPGLGPAREPERRWILVLCDRVNLGPTPSQSLLRRGFTTKQSEVVVAALLRVMHSSMEVTYKDFATKIQQEIMLQHIMSHMTSVKKDMIILEKSEFSAIRAANEKLKIELQQLKKQLIDEVVKVSSNNKLDMNLEKSRVQEMLTEHERRVLETRADIVELHSQQNRAVTQINRKIETEVAGLKTLLESHKLDTIKYLAGSVFTCLTVVLGFYRLWI
ncbi:mitochondrial calcium uniporter regulator 1-like isoform X2 [Carcharodon carcharias]|uniref:mitochondrial calcium uniporter regulator 1-like isoform X2 n=1 Tax=Carcharodon carcharias TaxID=13397 RepID=UPI001B7E90DC|nr:mitochondrial calcium uniporter regulator 1-like isoform X2 [Carcharodon carcharias]